ncbi:putative membrane spanning protein [Borrelia duttonii CR2A]|uniref:Putative membrane spanning protein n=1 Tax=Borrelia duttonii CR2A TaxID=1432657 RepID=W6TH96_9SPIR|nr:CRASP family complement regulator-acquiring lipoprotein [Borrelia duttonii]ETZ17880.1 putative membrane spanning protein [Borrelia duttonii CR2A]
MKRKDFILFIMFVFILILLLLVSCGPKKKYTPVSSAVGRNKVGVPLTKPRFGATALSGNGVSQVGTVTGTVGSQVGAGNGVSQVGAVTGTGNGVSQVGTVTGTVGSQVGAGNGGSQVGAVNVGLNGGAGDNEQILKQKEIKDIKIPDKVLKILETHDNENWDEDAAGYNLKGANQLFTKVKYSVIIEGGGLLYFLYNDATDETRAQESKALRREFYLACEYNANFIKAFAGVVNKLVATDELVDKNKVELEQFVETVRFYARFYYDAYSILKEKQNKLDALTLGQLQWLKAAFLELEKEQQELHKVIQLIINDYNNDTPINSSEPTHNLKSSDTLPSEIIQYWKEDTRSGEFISKRDVLANTSSKIVDLLGDL